MTHYINIREEFYPLTHACSGYSNERSNKCCSCTIADVESGNQPLSHARSGNLNVQEGNDLDNRKLCGTYSDRGCPAMGHPCPKACEHVIYTGIPETEGTPVFCGKYEKVRYAE